MNVLFFASGAFAIPAFDRLRQSSHAIVGVVSQPDRPAGRGRVLTPTPLAAHAAALGYAVQKSDNVNAADFIDWVAARKTDVIVAIAFGQKLSDALLAVATAGGINLHGSLLPAFRGAAPVNAAILSGASVTGVTVIRLSNVMDGGDILASREVPIHDDQTAGELHDVLAQTGGGLVPEVLDNFAVGNIAGVPQRRDLISKAPKLSRAMGWVNFSEPATAVSARIRGLSPWPGCHICFIAPDGTKKIEAHVLKCRAVAPIAASAPGTVIDGLRIVCGTGAVELLAIVPLGRKQMDMRAFANGYGVKPGWSVISSPPEIRN